MQVADRHLYNIAIYNHLVICTVQYRTVQYPTINKEEKKKKLGRLISFVQYEDYYASSNAFCDTTTSDGPLDGGVVNVNVNVVVVVTPRSNNSIWNIDAA